jgi:hypothetical protein
MCGKGPSEVRFRLNGSGNLRRFCDECSRSREGTYGPRRPSVQEDAASEHACSKCARSYPSTSQFYNYNNKADGLLKSYCKACQYGRAPGDFSSVKSTPAPTPPPADRRSVTPERTGLVPFHGAQVRGAVHEGEGWVRISDVCERLGVSHKDQVDKLQNNPSFGAYAREIIDGPGRPSWYLRGDKVPGWVRTINANKVKDEARAALLWVQEQFDKVLHAWVTGGAIPVSPASSVSQPANMSDIGTQLAQGVNVLFRIIQSAEDAAQRAAEAAGAAQRAAEMAADAAHRASEAATRAANNTDGARRIEVEVPGPTEHHHWNGWNYLLIDRSKGTCTIGGEICVYVSNGFVGYNLDDAGRRRLLGESRYNGPKGGGAWEWVHGFSTDYPAKSERQTHRLIEGSGAIRVGNFNDVYWISERTLAEYQQFPCRIALADLHKVAADLSLFLPPLFRNVA